MHASMQAMTRRLGKGVLLTGPRGVATRILAAYVYSRGVEVLIVGVVQALTKATLTMVYLTLQHVSG
jgi:hypothetical protein